jgi:hypothetical protein
MHSSLSFQKGLGSYKGREGKSEPGRRRRVPSPDKDPGRKSYRRKGGEPSSDKQRKKEESLRSGQPRLNSYPPDEQASEESLRGELSQPLDSYPPDERTSAFMHSERLREATVQREEPKKESLRGELSQPFDSYPPDERTSAFMHSERLREATTPQTTRSGRLEETMRDSRSMT